jgi:hypothetical protein
VCKGNIRARSDGIPDSSRILVNLDAASDIEVCTLNILNQAAACLVAFQKSELGDDRFPDFSRA